MKLPSLLRIDISEIGCETQDLIKVIEQQLAALITEQRCITAACFTFHDG